jgi:phage gp36-like protein
VSSYATVADMIDRFDERSLRDLCSDTGTAETDLTTNTKMLRALMSASGDVDVACQVGQIYTPAKLAALEMPAKAVLIDIVCGLAVAKLATRRPMRQEVAAVWKQSIDAANEYLDKFRNGQRVFPITENLEASVPSVEGPSTLDIPRQNLLTYRAHGFYPNPAGRLPQR